MNESSSCPDPEVLAAFIDGRLSGDRRRAVVEHLDACEDCYAVFSEAVRFQGEEEPRGRVVRTSRFGSRRWIWPAVAAAAVLVALVAVPLLRTGSSRPMMATLPDGREVVVSAGELVAAMHLSTPEEPGSLVEAEPWNRWPDEGGLSFGGAGLIRDEAAFRVGVRLIDLEMAARAGDEADARAAISGLQRILDAAGVLPKFEGRLAEASDLATRRAYSDLAALVARLERDAQKRLDPTHVAFGEWAETGRLAAALGDEALFSSSVFRAFQAEIASEDLPEDVSRTLGEIGDRIGPEGGSPAPRDMDELQRLFGRLVISH